MSSINEYLVGGALIGLGLLAGASFVALLASRDELKFEGHWGGFGGGLGGWTISRSLTYLITAIFFSTLLTILGGYALHKREQKPEKPNATAATPTDKGLSVTQSIIQGECERASCATTLQLAPSGSKTVPTGPKAPHPPARSTDTSPANAPPRANVSPGKSLPCTSSPSC